MSMAHRRDRRLEPRHAWDLLLASDPGLARVYLALRATLTAAFAALVLAGLSHALGQPFRLALLGVSVSITGTAFIQDAGRRAQMITAALLPIPALASLALATPLIAHPMAASLAFVAVMFASVAVRRFGPRGMSLGMVAFLAYLFAFFFRASVALLPWISLALVIALATGLVVRFYVVRDRPERALVHTERAFLASVRVVLRQLADASSGEPWPRVAGRRRLRGALVGRLLGLRGPDEEARLRGRDAHPADGGPILVAAGRTPEREDKGSRLRRREPPAHRGGA